MVNNNNNNLTNNSTIGNITMNAVDDIGIIN